MQADNDNILLCPYVSWREFFCKSQHGNCKYLHICHKWLSDMCTDTITNCPLKLSHNLLDEHNKKIICKFKISASGSNNIKCKEDLYDKLPKICAKTDINLKSIKGPCKDNCNNLHICFNIITNGWCNCKQKHFDCKQNHDLSEEKLVSKLKSYGIVISNIKAIEVSRHCEKNSDMNNIIRKALTNVIVQKPLLDFISKADVDEKMIKIGKGSFGDCYLIKITNRDYQEYNREFVYKELKHGWNQEVNIMYQIQNKKHVFLDIYGIYETNGYLMEYCLHGSLLSFIQKTNDKKSWLIFKLLTQVVEGLQCLHELDKPIYHQDVAITNILVTEELNAKIADFGYAKHQNSKFSSDSKHNWSNKAVERKAPEELEEENYEATAEKDCFQFGVCIKDAFAFEQKILHDSYRTMVMSGNHVDTFEKYVTDALVEYTSLKDVVVNIMKPLLQNIPSKRVSMKEVYDKWHPFLKENDKLVHQDEIQFKQQLSS